MVTIGRRDVISGGAAVLGMASVSACTATAIQGAGAPPAKATAQTAAPLKDRGAARGLYIGAATKSELLSGPYATVLASDFSMLVPEYQLQWQLNDPRTGRTAGRAAVTRIENFAAHNGQRMRGHAVYFHLQEPGWLAGELRSNPDRAGSLLQQRVADSVGRYAGRMHSWDVINEPLEPEHGRNDGLRVSHLLQAMGPAYIAEAFRLSHQADPGALLTLNEYGLEWGWEAGRKRRAAMLRLLDGLLSQGVPVHAVGIQGHLDPGQEGFLDRAAFSQFCRSVERMGLKLLVTELDARDSSIRAPIERRDQIVADAYGAFLDVVLARRALKAVLFWGFTDRHTWLNSRYPRADGARVRGDLYDENLQKKPAWYAVAKRLGQV